MVRAFSLIELMAVIGVSAVVSAVAVGVTVRTSQGLNNATAQMGVLEFIQRERNSHVNRAVETDVVVFCSAVGAADCTGAAGDSIVAYRSPLPVVFPPPPANELARVNFGGNRFTFAPAPALFVDAFARSVDDVGNPRNSVLTLTLRGDSEDIVFRADGVAVPSFEAPSAVVVAPHVADVGVRTTTNPTPQALPNSSFRARRVFLE